MLNNHAKTSVAAGYLAGKKTADKITKISRIPLENTLKIILNETEKIDLHREIPKKSTYFQKNEKDFL